MGSENLSKGDKTQYKSNRTDLRGENVLSLKKNDKIKWNVYDILPIFLSWGVIIPHTFAKV